MLKLMASWMSFSSLCTSSHLSSSFFRASSLASYASFCLRSLRYIGLVLGVVAILRSISAMRSMHFFSYRWIGSLDLPGRGASTGLSFTSSTVSARIFIWVCRALRAISVVSFSTREGLRVLLRFFFASRTGSADPSEVSTALFSVDGVEV